LDKIDQPDRVLIESSEADEAEGTLPRHAGDRWAAFPISSSFYNIAAIVCTFEDPPRPAGARGAARGNA